MMVHFRSLDRLKHFMQVVFLNQNLEILKNNIMINKYYFKNDNCFFVSQATFKINFYVFLKRPTGHLTCVS